MNDFYVKIAHLSERLAKLSPEQYQLLEKILQQSSVESENNSHVISNDSLSQALYQLEWQPMPLQKSSGNLSPGKDWLILADNHQQVGKQLAQTLEAEGDRCICVFPGQSYEKIAPSQYIINPLNPEDYHSLFRDIKQHQQALPQNVVHLWGLDFILEETTSATALQESQKQGCGTVLLLVQTLIAEIEKLPPRLWLISQGAKALPSSPEPLQVQQAPLWGLGQGINLEHPDFHCTNIDWGTPTKPEKIEVLSEQLRASEGEQQIIWRNGDRFVARLVRYSPQTVSEQPLSLPDDSSYLITGGLGALGLKMAQWLVEQGAKTVVLMSRREPSTAAQSVIQQLEQTGAKVSIIQGDVSNVDEITKGLTTIQNTLPPLRGIIHAAGIINDGILTQLSWDKFQTVMAAKIAGSWNLHQQTQKLPLDFFVCFSSMTSLVGNAGQANYAAANGFLDELAHHRRALGLPGLTINWGPWADVGMAAKLEQQKANPLASKGINQISLEQGLLMLGKLISQGVSQMGVMLIDWTKFLDQFPSGSHPLLLSEFAQQVQEQQRSSQTSELPTLALLKKQIQEATAQTREELLVTYLQNLVSKFLGISASDIPSRDQPLNEIGLDSLVSIQLRNRIRTELEIDLPLNKLTVDVTIAQIVAALQEQWLFKELVISESSSPEMEQEEEMEEFTL
ncbi:beta-ketoacyl reductase [Crocosphaera sp.]|uniref:beta-ketoacyl reductase n=1 Tax=Crocosphaera sp. TaxID=2729996 RepID=UPI003F1EFE07|nr:beta-ketoacyl reductase [Crocosphaera sp.]